MDFIATENGSAGELELLAEDVVEVAAGFFVVFADGFLIEIGCIGADVPVVIVVVIVAGGKGEEVAAVVVVDGLKISTTPLLTLSHPLLTLSHKDTVEVGTITGDSGIATAGIVEAGGRDGYS